MVQVLKVMQWSFYIKLSVEKFHCFIKGRVFNGSGKPVDKGPPVLAEDFLDIQGLYLVNLKERAVCVELLELLSHPHAILW